MTAMLIILCVGLAAVGALLIIARPNAAIPSIPPPPPPSREDRMRAFFKRELLVFHQGMCIGRTVLRPEVKRLLLERELTLVLNDAASEPRWEAALERTMSFHGNPNDAVLQCCALYDSGLIR